ncbi:MAG TPA: LysR family transcriptional regulator [Clostridiales bacterium]|nr:LysR family transcriptional regulator [Clostridiales bacterium]
MEAKRWQKVDLEIIKTVLMVAQLKSFSAAAFAIPCAQSSVSRRVESAERELGVTIFSRPSMGGSRNVELTDAGKDVIRAMTKVVDAYAEMFSIAGNDNATRTTIYIGMRRNMMAPMGLSLMKADFFEENPDIGITVNIDSFDAMFSELRMRKLDAVLFYCVSLDPSLFRLPEGIGLLSLGRVGFYLGISVENPLSRRASLRPEDLLDEEFLLGDEPGDSVTGITFSNPNRFNDAFKNVNVPRTKIIPSDMLEIRYKLVKENKGLLPSHTPVPWRCIDGVVYVPLEGVELDAHYYLLYISGRKESQIRAFARFFSKRLEHD